MFSLADSQRNIRLLYLIKFAKWFMITMPIIGLFYNSNGLGEKDVYLIQAGYSLATALLEIPSGYLADRWGRRRLLIAGSLLGIAGYALYVGSHTFWGMFFAELVLGIGASFISGTDSALLYDSLIVVGRRGEYFKYEGRVTAYGSFFETAGAVIGGSVAAWFSLRWAFGLQLCVAALALPAAYLLREPPHNRSSHASLREIVNISRLSLWGGGSLSRASWMSAAAGASTLCLAWTVQAFFIAVQADSWEATAVWIGLNLTAAMVSFWAHQAAKRFAPQYLLLFVVVSLPLAYLSLGSLSLWLAVPGLVLGYIGRGLATPLCKDMIGSHCPSAIRATVLSVRGMQIRLMFSLMGMGIAYLSAHYSFRLALFACAAVCTMGLVLAYRGAAKVYVQERSDEI